MLNLIELPWQRMRDGLSSSDDTSSSIGLATETWNTKTETNILNYQFIIKEISRNWDDYTAGVDGWWTLNGNERVAIFRW